MPRKRKSTRKTTRKIEPPKLAGKPVSELSTEQKLIRRFVNLDGKSKTKGQVRNVLNSIQRAITRKLVRKSSKFASEIMFAQDFLIKQLREMGDKPETFEKVFTISPKKKVPELMKAAENEHQLPSVRLILRYVSMQHRDVDVPRAKRLLTAIDRAFTRKLVTGRDPYKNDLQLIRTRLKKFIEGEDNYLSPTSTELRGLEGILQGVGYSFCQPPEDYQLNGFDDEFEPVDFEEGYDEFDDKDETDFISLDDLDSEATGEIIRLDGPIGELLGDLEQNECAITIKGPEGSGKSSLLMQIADAFAEEGFNVGIVSLEMSRKTNKFKSLVKRFVAPINKAFVRVAGAVRSGLQSLKSAARRFDVILVDSFGKADLKPADLNELRKQYPGTIWGFIFQLTVLGNARGGKMPEFDGDIVIEIVKPDAAFTNNYAVCTKNRFGGNGQTLPD